MASLTGEQLKDTYDSLLKVDDNGSLGGTYKEITDGLGNGSGLYLGTGGNVGIGTTSPSKKLDVNGEITANDEITINSSTNTAIVLQGGAEQDAILKLTESGLSGARVMYDGGDNKLYIGTGTGDTFTTRMTFLRDSLGVGIGTDAPDRALHVNGSVRINDGYSLSMGAGAEQRILAGGTSSSTYLTFSQWTGASFSERMRIDLSGNLLVGTTSTPTSSAGNIVLKNGTAPTGNATDGVILYAQDVSTSSELKVRDEAGNVTTLSPHNFSLIPDGASEEMAWAYYSERDGKKINVDMLKLARMVESLTGEKLVYEQ
jgi:hypothetical protein